MKKRTLWLGLSFLLVAALVLTGCPAPVVEKEKEEVEFPILSIGETYQTPEVEVTVSEAIVTESYEYYDQASESMVTKEADPGMSFLIVTAEIKNVSSLWRATEGHGRFFAWDAESVLGTAMARPGEDYLPSRHRLGAGAKVEGKILFEIREGARDLAIHIAPYGRYRRHW